MLKEYVTTITNNYLIEKNLSLKNNSLANYIRTEPKKIFTNDFFKSNQYIIKGSAGQGNWATIPWLAIFDKEITEKAEKGFYIVYLFKSNMKGFYLSLNQGWTYYKKTFNHTAKKEILLVTSNWQNILAPYINNSLFKEKRIDLDKKNDLAKGYELGNICAKYYDSTKLNNDELKTDLFNLINIYRELKRKL